MTLAKQLWTLWQKLDRGKHWTGYFKEAGLDLSKADESTLLPMLMKKIVINRRLHGLEEFSLDGVRGIEPGSPATSLFYHAFASPHVHPRGIPARSYPRFKDLAILENCIYSAAGLSLADLLGLASQSSLAVVVFAYEYAPARDTVHGRHADLCFSRTGLSRVGTKPPHYMPGERGYFPRSGDSKEVHVVPARFGAFLSILRDADPGNFGPLRATGEDAQRRFWVPLLKLFDGPECIQGIDLKLTFTANHVNEKIAKVHLALQSQGIDTGWNAAQMRQPPFRITEQLAAFSKEDGLLTPVPHAPLVHPVKANRESPPATPRLRYVGFRVPANPTVYTGNRVTLWFPPPDWDQTSRQWPEFVHIKHAIVPHGATGEKIEYLPDVPNTDLAQVIEKGNFQAANFVDYTADGSIAVACPALQIPQLPAYSIIGQPDFFPLIQQRHLMDWWQTEENKKIREYLWSTGEISPSPLSDTRLPANITLKDDLFDSTDQTMTAIIGAYAKPARQGTVRADTPTRASTLPDRASSVFAPGWDIGADFGRDAKSPNGTRHLANYGLGSPFPEDTLLCAALGSYWPAAAPDITRFFPPFDIYPTITPFPDRQARALGMNLPHLVGKKIEFTSPSYADFVESIYRDVLIYEIFADDTIEDYELRTLVTARVFDALKVSVPKERAKYVFTGFRLCSAAEFNDLPAKAQGKLDRPGTYRIAVAYVPGNSASMPGNPRKVIAVVEESYLFFVGRKTLVRHAPSAPGGWLVQSF